MDLIRVVVFDLIVISTITLERDGLDEVIFEVAVVLLVCNNFE